jgi:hypothetical protein
MSALKSLNSFSTNISPLGIQAIFEGFQRNLSLQYLDLLENAGIGSQLATSLVESLPQMMSLHILNVEMVGFRSSLMNAKISRRPLQRECLSTPSSGRLMVLSCTKLAFFLQTKREGEVQRQCLRYLKAIGFYKFRNSIISGKCLMMDQLALWPFSWPMCWAIPVSIMT